MGTPSNLDRAMLHSKNLGKCTNPHDDLGPEFDECPLFDSKNPSCKYCGACGCLMRFHMKPNFDSRDDDMSVDLDPKHKVFLSHSGKQKDFVEQLYLDLQRLDRYVFFDKDPNSLPIGEDFPRLIFKAIQQCHVGVVILSDEFFTSKWPMMELVAMVEEARKREFSFKIIPVFLHSLLQDICEDSPKLIEWQSLWKKWALGNPKRINVKEWEDSLKYLRSTNGLKYIVYDKLGEVRFREVIIDAICTVVPPEIKLEVSHIQGRSRICEVIHKKIVEVQQKNKFNDICIVGLYGMGGIGKTSICKVLYNEFLTKFQTRVCHAELERKTEEELLQEVLKRLTDINPKLFNGRNTDELWDLLNRGIGKQRIFLALDNMSDASILEAQHYLSQSFMPGSIIIVTARSLGLLLQLRPYLDETNCLEMPDLEEEEAKSLFSKSSKFEPRNEIDEQLILRCLERCRFRKDVDKEHCHFHPLALHVLGTQLGFIDPGQWRLQLDKINEDIFNPSRKNSHPIFFVLRKSFETLSYKDQLLFIDVALFLPGQGRNGLECNYECNVFEWLRMVHKIASVNEVITRLEMLKTRSLLERVGDGIKTSIGMHDLWRAFCVAETENGELGYRRWVYETNKCSELLENTPSGTWVNVKRMAFPDCDSELKSLEGQNFAHFPNVTVLMLSGQRTEELVLNLSELQNLKSLEVRCDHLSGLVLRGLPRGLVFLSFRHSNDFILNRLTSVVVQRLIKQIGGLKELQSLQLIGYPGPKLPDMGKMVFLRVASLCGCLSVDTITGLSSKLTNLRVLDFRECRNLRSCPGVGDLVALEELNGSGCESLAKLPNLQRLRNLRKLDISHCPLIVELPGLGDLVALEEFYASEIMRSKLELPDMLNLTNLQVLLLGYRVLEAVPGFDNLISLREVVVDFREVVEQPNLQQLTKLQKLDIRGWISPALGGLDNLTTLRSLDMYYCSGVDQLLDCRGMISLQALKIEGCEFKDVLGLSYLSALERLLILRCRNLERLPDWQGLTRLKSLDVSACAVLIDCNCTLAQVEGGSCRLDNMSDSQRLTGSGPSVLSPYGLGGVTSVGSYSQVDTLKFWNVEVRELPDLSNFPRLRILWLEKCDSLRMLRSRESINTLLKLKLTSCSSLATLPNLCNFPALPKLKLSDCGGVISLSSRGPLTALTILNMRSCINLEILPDLELFPALEVLKMSKCSRLRALRCSVPLLKLQGLELMHCISLEALPDLGMFPALQHLHLEGYNRLMTLNSSMPLLKLQGLELMHCISLEALPDLGMFPALQHLHLEGCDRLMTLNSSMPLTAFSNLELRMCPDLKAFPNLGMFPALRHLDVDECSGLMKVNSSMPSTTLVMLSLENCSGLEALPDLGMFPALQELLLKGCSRLRTLSCSVTLTALQKLNLRNCIGLESLPGLEMFPELEHLDLYKCSKLTLLSSSATFDAWCTLSLEYCNGLKALPDLGMFPALEALLLSGCSGLTVFSSSVTLTALKMLKLEDCSSLEALPILGMCPALDSLLVKGCSGFTMLSSGVTLTTSLKVLDLQKCSGLRALPILGMCPALESLFLYGCSGLTTLSSNVTLTALKVLQLEDCSGLDALPILRMCPALKSLYLYECSGFTMLSSNATLIALEVLQLKDCSGLKALPILRMCPALQSLRITRCNGLTTLSLGMCPYSELVLKSCHGLTTFNSSVTLTALKWLELKDCRFLKALPILEMCPALKFLSLDGCSGLTTLSSNVTLTELGSLHLSGCSRLETLPILGMCPALKCLMLRECSGLKNLSSIKAMLNATSEVWQ